MVDDVEDGDHEEPEQESQDSRQELLSEQESQVTGKGWGCSSIADAQQLRGKLRSEFPCFRVPDPHQGFDQPLGKASGQDYEKPYLEGRQVWKSSRWVPRLTL